MREHENDSCWIEKTFQEETSEKTLRFKTFEAKIKLFLFLKSDPNKQKNIPTQKKMNTCSKFNVIQLKRCFGILLVC
jgi:hypothetical protein